MSRKHVRSESNIALVILRNLGWPLVGGLGACFLFYFAVNRGLGGELLARYTTGHPLLYIETALFFVAMAALTIKFFEVSAQYATLGEIALPKSESSDPVQETPRLLAALEDISTRAHRSYLGRRLHDALNSLKRRGSAEGFDDELRYLADMDGARQHDGYALVRLVVWAIPIVGFLGTVIGITMAIKNLAPEAEQLAESMSALTAALSVAFDTTTVALSLSIVLMFLQYLVDRVETELLSTVDTRVEQELVGRFRHEAGNNDPQLGAIRRMAQSVIGATEEVVRQQEEIWRSTIDAAHQQWSNLTQESGKQLEQSLAAALDSSLQKHAVTAAEIQQQNVEQQNAQTERIAQLLGESHQQMASQQEQSLRQGEVMLKAIEASGQVATLQQALNQNLESLAGSRNFEETVMSLSAAIHLLNARLGHAGSARVELEDNASDSQDRAA